MKKALFGISCLILIGAFVLGSSYYKKRQAEKLGFLARGDASTFIRDHSPALGEDDAKVFVVKFTDPACETCAAFADFIQQAMAAYPGKIKFVIRYAPFHAGSSDAVRILEAAKMQGRFWETLHVLYATQAGWVQHHQVQPEKIWQFLGHAGVNVERARKDIGDPAITRVIETDLKDAETLGVQKTPGFFVNGKPLEPFGAGPLRDLITAEIKANYPGS